ncbi:MAG: ABC transporter ATP-binding protein, partial [Pseudomonadota bacterium]
QNVWLGLAAIALIPLQGWLIPLLQRRINLLNKKRVVEVRALSGEIGETAAGVADLRLNGGWRRRMALITQRLGRLFDIRYRIYRQKFFMKFLNNFITQLTPFFFFSIGGYLAIQGELTVGALVAALAAYKDLSAPWKELLLYYNQVQDMSLRWQIITERFAPSGMIDTELFEGDCAEFPRLNGGISFDRVTLRDVDGTPVLEDLSLEIPAGTSIAITSGSANERRAMAELLVREVVPSSGRIKVGEQMLSELHQDVIAARIGLASTRPYLFSGTIGENITMPLTACPGEGAPDDPETAEAIRAGNSRSAPDAGWLKPSLAGVADQEELRDWWFEITQAMGTSSYLFSRGLDARFDAAEHPDLAKRLVALRPQIARRIAGEKLTGTLHPFLADRFNPGLPVAGNLLFAVPTREIAQEDIAKDTRFRAMLRDLKLEDELLDLGQSVLGLLSRVFGMKGTDHPMFVKLGIDAEFFEKLTGIERSVREKGLDVLDADARGLLMTVPFR